MEACPPSSCVPSSPTPLISFSFHPSLRCIQLLCKDPKSGQTAPRSSRDSPRGVPAPATPMPPSQSPNPSPKGFANLPKGDRSPRGKEAA